MSDLADDVTRILFESSFMTLATSDASGTPWAIPVEYACDKHGRFYWSSLVEARHSRNVRVNPRAAASIFDSTQVPGVHAEAQGIYVEGSVEEFRDDDLADVRPSLRRWLQVRRAAQPSTAPEPPASPDFDESAWRTYRLSPSGIYALDPAGHPDFPGIRVWRVRLELADSFAREYRSRIG